MARASKCENTMMLQDAISTHINYLTDNGHLKSSSGLLERDSTLKSDKELEPLREDAVLEHPNSVSLN